MAMDRPPLVIARFTSDHVEPVANLSLGAYPHLRPAPEQIKALGRRVAHQVAHSKLQGELYSYLREPGFAGFVALRGKKVAGFVAVHPPDGFGYPYPLLHTLAVAPKERIGRQLIEAAKAYASTLSAPRLYLEADIALRKYYERHGAVLDQHLAKFHPNGNPMGLFYFPLDSKK